MSNDTAERASTQAEAQIDWGFVEDCQNADVALDFAAAIYGVRIHADSVRKAAAEAENAGCRPLRELLNRAGRAEELAVECYQRAQELIWDVKELPVLWDTKRTARKMLDAAEDAIKQAEADRMEVKRHHRKGMALRAQRLFASVADGKVDFYDALRMASRFN